MKTYILNRRRGFVNSKFLTHPFKMLKFSQKEKQIGKRIFRKFAQEKKKNPRLPLISFDYLYKILKAKERELLDKILTVNPKEYGKNFTEFYGIFPVPKNLAAIKNFTLSKVEGQKYRRGKKVKTIKTQFLPKPVFWAYNRLNQAMERDIGRTVNVASGYRSPAYQAVVLFNYLYECRWNMKKALRRVTLPGCSEHGYPSRQGVDFGSVKEISSSKNFYKTKEYKWLLKNAHRFGFFLSYPAGNKFGVDFEPWHWSYKKPKTKNL